MVFGLDDVALAFEARILLSIAIALGALVAAYGIRRLRTMLADRIAPVAVDVVGSIASIGVMVLAVVLIATVWEQADTLLGQFGFRTLEDRAPQIAVTVVVVIAVQVLTTVVSRLLDDITRESDAMSEHEREIGFRVTQLVLWIAGMFVILGVWSVDLGGLLIGAGFLGIVLGLAAQQTLGSLLAGFTLMFSRPFEVGDWIVVGEGQAENEGVVTDITMMDTRIQAFDGEFVVVPNDVIAGRTVRNRSRKGRLRIEVEVGVDYTDDVEHAREVATEAISEIDMIMQVPRPECVIKSFDDSAVTLAARGWIEHPSSRRRWRATTRMVNAIKDAFAEAGVKIPFPQREVSGREEHGGFRVARPQDTRANAPPAEDDTQDGGAAGRSAEAGPEGTSNGSSDGAATGESADTSSETSSDEPDAPAEEVRPDGARSGSPEDAGGDDE